MAKVDLELSGFFPLTVAEALRRTAATAPDIEAIVAPDGRVTWGALADDVARVGADLAAQGIRKGDRVGLCLGNSVQWMAIFLALGSLGAVTVPVNTRFVASEMAYALRQSKVGTLITCDRLFKIDFIAMLREICPALDHSLPDPAVPELRKIIVIGNDVPAGAVGWSSIAIAGTAGAAATQACGPDDPLLIQYTSGTTSFPKGVVLTHRNMLANAYFSGLRMGLRPGDRFHSARPFFHVAGTTLSILSVLQHAATLVSMDRFEAGEALRLMEAERCTHFSGNDTMALMLLNHADRARRKLSLRGAWLAASPTIVRRVIDELGARECVVGYGLSEASPNVAQSCFWEPEEIRVSAAMRLEPGVSVRIRSSDGSDAGIGESGEILVRGWNVMLGYFDKPKETAEALDTEGWLATGDLGSLDASGRLTFLGRAKEIIRVGGENVSPADVENALHRHPAIRQAAVVGVPEERLVEVPAAFVILNDGHAADAEEIKAWAKSEMAGFKVPRHVWIVDSFEAIGMTASSKIQKKQLAAHARGLLGL
ncbi:AMP-binding protein [Mesorhizobium sp. CU2]|uniref:AMP-binding protein n=1 Tax=unclassified Mesorhizobium TaxID=325217 RepID=UPI0011280395|nr:MULTISPECIES: AMP-binding protein [unclassified Mesorhizobium]TPN85611.1 AMP-binding protein [Mesorhizobium sp. CU3]TPO10289.1 AMP-binding protein [Mesorhizobium sp. CU2]